MSFDILWSNKLLKRMKKKTNKRRAFKIVLQDSAKQSGVPSKEQFQIWVAEALVTPSPAKEITIRIVNAEESAALNHTYRNKSGPTNVLSFVYSPIPGEKVSSLGDIVICAELVKKEAAAEKKPLLAHWAHLTIHGALHLQGYDHQEESAAHEMETLETRILGELGFSDPYQQLTQD